MEPMSFRQMLLNCADRFGDRIAIRDQKSAYTYAQLVKAVEVCSDKLKALGVKQDAHVALWSYNSADWLIAFFGIIQARGIPVLFNYSLTLGELSSMFRYTDVRYIVHGENRETKRNPTAAAELAAYAGLSQTAVYDIRMSDYGREAEYVRIVEPGTDNTDCSRRRSDFILFTTGTTGQAKAVQISQVSFLMDSVEIVDALPEFEKRHIHFCLGSPLFHVLGLEMAIGNLFFGATIEIPSNFSADTLLDLFSEQHIDFMAATGAAYISMIRNPRFGRVAVCCPKYCLAGGGTVTPAQFMRLESLFGHTIFLNDYGQTEIGSTLTRIRPTDRVEKRLNSVGRPFRHKHVEIMDEGRRILPAGEKGEVVVKDDGNLMLGYYKLPEEQVIDEDGWLHTGDLGFLDKEGYLYLSGRIKDIIIKGGENISPREVEAALSRNEGVLEAKVFGAPHSIWGESIEACVVPSDKEAFDEQKLKASLAKMIAPFKIPSHIFCYESFPLNANGKLNQRALKASMLERLAEEK